MLRTTTVKLGALLGAAAIAIPAAAAADPNVGGLQYDDADAPTVTADGSSLHAALGSLLGRPLRITGALNGVPAGSAVEVQRLDRRRGWVTAATTTVGAGGTFTAAWRADHSGKTTVRAIPAGTGASAQAAAAAPAREVTVYRPAVATWYGPGLFGRRTACGRKLTRRLLGVAHKTLPCGAQVELFKDGRTITVPVVDRGPFRRGTTWDLTAATAKVLGVTATTTVGAVTVRR